MGELILNLLAEKIVSFVTDSSKGCWLEKKITIEIDSRITEIVLTKHPLYLRVLKNYQSRN
jgi:hypothetical protein